MHIATLLQAVLTNSGVYKTEFIRRLGYRNLSKGRRRFDQAVETGQVPKPFLESVSKTYGIASDVLEDAIAETRRVAELEELVEKVRLEIFRRKQFKPYFWLETEKHTRSVITSISTNHRRKIPLPNHLIVQSQEKVIEGVRLMVINDYRERGGVFPPLGCITGYRFVRSYDESILFDIHGQPRAEKNETFFEPITFFRIPR